MSDESSPNCIRPIILIVILELLHDVTNVKLRSKQCTMFAQVSPTCSNRYSPHINPWHQTTAVHWVLAIKQGKLNALIFCRLILCALYNVHVCIIDRAGGCECFFWHPSLWISHHLTDSWPPIEVHWLSAAAGVTAPNKDFHHTSPSFNCSTFNTAIRLTAHQCICK